MAHGWCLSELPTDLIDSGMRVVAPLFPVSDSPKPIGRLQPVFEINGAAHVLHTAELAAIPSTLIKSALVADLSECPTQKVMMRSNTLQADG